MSGKNLFGNSIAPDCRYCSYGDGPESDPRCTAHSVRPLQEHLKKSGSCAYFRYDPLLRKPNLSPPLQEFDPEAFQL